MNDNAARMDALDPQQSFIVAAPAGSGKTGLITQRVLRLLRTVESPEQILCITFTRKAAAEMALRVHNALRDALINPRPDDSYKAQTWDLAAAAVEHSKQMGWELMDMPNRLRIQTIDGFSRYIASQFALETEIGVLPEPSDNIVSLYRVAARNLLDKLEEDSDSGRYIAVLLAHMGNDIERCERLLSELLSNREQWLPLIFNVANNHQYFQQVVEQLIDESLFRLEDSLQPIAGELIELIDYAANNVPVDKNPQLLELKGIVDLPDNSFSGLSQWKTIVGLMMTKDLKLRKSITITQGFPKQDPHTKSRMLGLLDWCRQNADVQEQLSNTLFLPDADLSSSQQAILDALGYLLPTLAAELTVVFKQQEQCDYPAITLAALDALQQSAYDQQITDITLRLDYSLRHILVDEFQDTSGAQMQLLEHLVAGWEPDDGRTLFLVGDAMQSLYGFRNANVGLFLQAQQYPIGPVQCRPLTLSTNFRSQQGIIDWVNNSFSRAFPERADSARGAIPYSPSTAHNALESGNAVQFFGFSCEDSKDYAEAEAARVAATCVDIQQHHSGQSLAILVRNRGHLQQIIPALRHANLNWQAIDISPLKSLMPVMDMLSLTRALLSPADRIAWLSVLRAPFCGLGLDDLVIISNTLEVSGKTPLALLHQLQAVDYTENNHLSPYARRRLQHIIPCIQQAWQMRGKGCLRSIIEQLWLQLGGPSTLRDSAELDDVRCFLDLLEHWQVAGTLADWEGFLQAADKLFATPNVGDMDAATPSIQIMTIHKAKGLEFDHVLLPGLSRSPKSPDKPLLRWQQTINQQGESSLIMAPLGAHDEEDDSIYDYLKHEAAIKTQLENTRVLYVAATRAVSKLYLFAQVTEKGSDWQAPAKTSLLSSLWQTIKTGLDDNSLSVIQVEANNAPSEKRTSLSHKRRLPITFCPPQAPTLALLTGVEGNRKRQHHSDQPSADSTRLAHLGTIMHRTIKQIAIEGPSAWPERRLNKMPISWRAQLKELGVLVSEQELASMSKALVNMLNDDDGLWILQPHTQAHCEQALGYSAAVAGCRDGGVSVIDRTFVTDGVRWIIDYKFSAPNADESVAVFSARQTTAYRAQLQHYANLYRQIDTTPVRGALYFPQIPLFIEVSLD